MGLCWAVLRGDTEAPKGSAATAREVGAPGPGRRLSPFSAPARSVTLSLLDAAARVPLALRASFADRTLAWVWPWGRRQLISAPFLFHPQRFFEVGQSQAPHPGH